MKQELVQKVPDVAAPWTAIGEQDSSVVQSGDVSSSSQQAGHVNSAGWDGPLVESASGPVVTAPPVAVSTITQSTTGSVTSSVLPLARPELPPALVGALRMPPLQSPVVRGGRRAHAPAPQPPAAAPALRPAPHASVTAVVESPPAPGCSPLCRLLGGTAGALEHGRAPGQAPTATADVHFMLAAFPVWRLQLSSPAPGRPVVLAPDERPG